ncbi:hypothetical protein N9J26_00295, partial [bacterium]|nr:hypothetical protein [bacterium]
KRPFDTVNVPVLVEPNTTALAEPNAVALRRSVAPPAEAVIESPDNTKALVQGFGALSLTSDLISGLLSALLDGVHEDADLQGNNGSFTVEIFITGLDWLSWLGSFPASPNNPGGFPYLVHKHKVNIKDNPQEFWQRVVWGWRTAVLALDTIYLAAGLLSSTKKIPGRVNTEGLSKLASALNIQGDKSVLQRMRRGTRNTMKIQMGLSAVDLVLTSIYLSTLPNRKKPGLEIANEIIGILPGFLTPMRTVKASPETMAISAASLGFIQAGKTVINFGMGIKLLVDTVDDL